MIISHWSKLFRFDWAAIRFTEDKSRLITLVTIRNTMNSIAAVQLLSKAMGVGVGVGVG